MADDGLAQIKRTYGLNSYDVRLPTPSNILVAAKATTRRIVILRVTFAPSSFVTGTIQLKDSLTGETVVTLTIPPGAAGNGIDTIGAAFDGVGTPLSLGANLVLGTLPAGAAGRLHIETYQKGRG